MSSQGMSLHLGLNRVNPTAYEGWDGKLTACEFDAKDLQALAKKQGFSTRILLTQQVTASAVIEAIQRAALDLQPGDLLLLTYSGHGGQVPDTNHDETAVPSGLKDRYDETWVLYDRQLIDDELHALWAKFKPGVRIFVLSDSCHSGTVVKLMPAFLTPAEPSLACRFLPRWVADKNYQQHRALYDGLQKNLPSTEKARVKATVILISGCQDNQFSQDGTRNGLFTGNLRKVWAQGKFTGGYRAFRDQIADRMPPDQTPNYFVVGAANATFEAQKPFTI
jgi:metacaspase-1